MTPTARQISNALDSPLPEKNLFDPDRPYTAIVTDSRKIVPGCLFVAIPGDTFDGNDFVVKALAQGASAALCRTGTAAKAGIDPRAPGAWLFEVPDTVEAFRKVAASWRKTFEIPLALVGGSAGKTTTKELLAALLGGAWGADAVLKTQGSNNGFVGIPITLMGLAPRHRAAVIEVGIDEPGSMIRHCEMVEPTVSLLTSIGAEHLEKLIDLDTVAREEGVAFEHALASRSGRVVVNRDDPRIAPWFKKAPAERRLGFSLTEPASADSLRGTVEGSELAVEGAGFIQPGARFPLPLPGRHNACNLLGAIAAAHAMGIRPAQMLEGIRSFTPSEGRSQVREPAPGIRVLCDYYNSQPPSLAAALELMAELSHPRPAQPASIRWACLGDMLELGPRELEFHREIAPRILALGTEHVLLFGERMKALADELEKIGFSGDLRHFSGREELAQALISGLQRPALVLIKGSRGMKMEEVWRPLEASLRK
jgi:UDP-N-acetylmuramoyl-tripeptide--D-alanyl-D-alanine ligase